MKSELYRYHLSLWLVTRRSPSSTQHRYGLLVCRCRSIYVAWECFDGEIYGYDTILIFRGIIYSWKGRPRAAFVSEDSDVATLSVFSPWGSHSRGMLSRLSQDVNTSWLLLDPAGSSHRQMHHTGWALGDDGLSGGRLWNLACLAPLFVESHYGMQVIRSFYIFLYFWQDFIMTFLLGSFSKLLRSRYRAMISAFWEVW